METRSFSETARALGVSTSAVSAAIIRLEQKLSVRLLNRTTRSVAPTPEGAEFYHKCKQIIADLEQAELSVSRSGRTPSGTLRIGMPAALGRMWVIPSLHKFMQAYPDINLEIVLEDFIAGPGSEALDATIQVGDVPSSRLTIRKLASVDYVMCASPDYLARRGWPAAPTDLATHHCLLYRRPRNGQIRDWQFSGKSKKDRPKVNGHMTFNSGEALTAAAISGLGIIQVGQYYVQPWLASGDLMELLPQHRVHAYDISVLFQQRKRMPSRLRVFIDFLVETFEPPPWIASADRKTTA